MIKRSIYMKKIISLLLALILCLSFTACSGPNADMTEENITETVAAVETALKNFDTDDLDKYVDSSTLSVIIGYAESHEQFADLGRAIFANLEMDITNIDMENKTVTVTAMNKDLSAATSEFAQSLKDSYSTFALLRKLSDDTFLDEKLAELQGTIANCQLMDEGIEIVLNIEQGSKNLVFSFDSLDEDAVSGGALSAIKEIYGIS